VEESEWLVLLQEADINKDGKIDIKDFLSMMHEVKQYQKKYK
jgi:Ca2+-binding EF-hand superfamily protein